MTDSTSLPSWALSLLQCPITGESLQFANQGLVSELRKRQQHGQLINQVGVPCEDEFDLGLVNQSATFFYPVWQQIPTLLRSTAIPLVAR